MALSRLIKLNEICKQSKLLHKLNNLESFHCRTFRRLNKEDKKKGAFESFASLFKNNNAEGNNLHIRNLLKPLGFTFIFSSVCFGGATIWQYENMRTNAIAMLKQPIGFPNRRSDGYIKTGNFRRKLNMWWNSLTPGEKVFVPICFLNILVYTAWRIPQWGPFMLKYFCSNPESKNVCWPMLLSTFSHNSFLHLAVNMYVLHSFSSGAVASLGKEQFLGLYLSAGVISSFTSYFYKTMTKQPGLSLGASGAIMAILGYICSEYPDTSLNIIFLKFITFSAGTAIKCIIGFDLAGVVLGWKIFDHAAHLGGIFCGIAWSYWGNKHLWHKREPIIQYWHDLRGAVK